MIKGELIDHFSERLRGGSNISELRDEALKNGYNPGDIEDTLSELMKNMSYTKEDGSEFYKIVILSILIFIVLFVIITIIVINIDKKAPVNNINIIEKNESPEKLFYEMNISTDIFNNTEESMNLYLINNMKEQENSIRLSENLASCNNTHANFYGKYPEMNGQLSIEDMGNDRCIVSYHANLTMDCNFSKDQIRNIVESRERNKRVIYGPFYYLGSFLEIQMRIIGELFKKTIEESLNKIGPVFNDSIKSVENNFNVKNTVNSSFNSSLGGESLMSDVIYRNFTNNQTGEVYTIKCDLY